MNKKTIIALFLVSLSVIGASAFWTFDKKSKNQVVSNQNESIKLSTIKVNDGENIIFRDVKSVTNFDQAIKESDTIVMGEVLKNAGTRNLLRNPNNPKEEFQGRKIMSQEYIFKITKSFKGQSQKEIDVVYSDYSVSSDGKKLNEGNIALEKGQKYVLFLKKDTSLGETIFLPSSEPWQFKVKGGKIEPITPIIESSIVSEEKQTQNGKPDLKEFEKLNETSLMDLLNKIPQIGG